MKTLLSTVALVAFTVLVPARAMAQDSDDAEVTKMAKEHYKAGLDAYKAGKYDVAIKELKKAYLLKRLPALLLNIGATYRKMGDLDLALHFYKKYLDEAPSDARDRNDVEKTIADIKIEKEGGGPAEPEVKHDEPPPPPPRKRPRESDSEAMPKEWSHNVVDAAPPDTPFDVRVSMPVMKGVKVYVYYRLPGKEDFTPVLMKRKGTEKVGRIPADVMQGKAIQYYIEARDPAGTVVQASGSQTSPNIVMIDPGAKPQMLASMDRERDMEEPRERDRDREPAEDPPRGRNLDDESAPVMGQVDERRKPRSSTSKPSKFGSMFYAGVGLMAVGVAGVGLGVAGLAVAKSKSDSVSETSMRPVDLDGQPIFFNNDPVATASGVPQEVEHEKLGKTMDAVGIAGLAIGGVALVTGAVLMGVERGLAGQRERPARPKRRRRVVVDEEASIQNLYIAPTAGPNFAGAGAGFSF